MEKKFLKTSLLFILTTSVLSVIMAIIYFIVYIKVDYGPSLFSFLGYVKDAFDSIAIFTGFGTIIYSVAKFDFRTRTWVMGITILGIVPLLIFQLCTYVPYFEYSSGNLLKPGVELSQFFFNGMYSNIGMNLVNQILPAFVVLLLAVLIIKDKGESPDKVISFSNRSQRTMIISSLVVFAIVILSNFLVSMLPIMIENNFVFYREDFNELMSAFGKHLLETAILNIVVCYAIELILFKVYDKILNDERKV